jgi:anti-anti-sigma factor
MSCSERMSLVISSSSEGPVLTLVVQVSRLDAAAARDFKSGVEASWRTGITQVVLDLSAVEFVDSSGVGALLNVYRRLPQGTGSARLRGVRPGVQAVLELLRLHRLFEIS